MRLTPNSMARFSALTDSSSVPPSHCFPPIPQAPYPISLTSKPVLPSVRYFMCSYPLCLCCCERGRSRFYIRKRPKQRAVPDNPSEERFEHAAYTYGCAKG